MLSGSAANMAPLIAENIRSALAAQPIQTSDAQLIAQTTSIGIASGQAGQASLRQLVMEADMALYQAKQKGRNCVCSSALSGQHPTASAAD
jgi:diguanylate cyclase (GGDEF)-like protein